MKKFLVFLLIAVIACTAVEDFELNGLWGKIKGWLNSAWDWIYDHTIGKLQEWAINQVNKACQKYIGLNCYPF